MKVTVEFEQEEKAPWIFPEQHQQSYLTLSSEVFDELVVKFGLIPTNTCPSCNSASCIRFSYTSPHFGHWEIPMCKAFNGTVGVSDWINIRLDYSQIFSAMIKEL